MSKGFVNIILGWLTARPDHARMAVTIDGNRLLADAGILAEDTVLEY